MPDFEKLENEAQQAAQGHPEQVDEGIAKGEQEIDQRAGQDRAGDVQKAGSELEKDLGVGESPQPPDQP